MDTKTESSTQLTALHWFIGIAITIILILAIGYFNFFILANSKDLGTTGDAVGGLLNPILTTVTVILLISTIRQNQKMIVQNEQVIRDSRKELKLSRKELKRSRKIFKQELKNTELKTSFEIIERICDEALQIQDLKSISESPKNSITLREFVDGISIGKYSDSTASNLMKQVHKMDTAKFRLYELFRLGDILLNRIDEICTEKNELHHIFKGNSLITFFLRLDSLYHISELGNQDIQESDLKKRNDVIIKRIGNVILYRYIPEHARPTSLITN